MVLLVDYGMGNLRSVEKALEAVGADVRVSSSPADIDRARLVVVPGVGAFDHAVRELKSRKLFDPIRRAAASGKPYLGLCLGMQLLFERSDEGVEEGWGLLRGSVLRFPRFMKTPHMGWNRVRLATPALERAYGIEGDGRFYFVHSYFVASRDASDAFGTTDYGFDFTSAVKKGNIMATQFHPEKSQAQGLRFLKAAVRELTR
jgi:imidazole glycerol-phosphate synthase subunit HisH